MLKKIILILVILLIVLLLSFSLMGMVTHMKQDDSVDRVVVGVYDHQEETCRQINSYTDYEIMNSCDVRYDLIYYTLVTE